jgi:fatty acyl-CoA reductase
MQPLTEYYDDRVVLLTGATGFLGKIVLERLLWEFPTMRQLRVMIRGDAAARLDALWPLELFDRLRERHGGQDAFVAWAKAVTVPCAGDIESTDLGLSGEQLADLKGGLNIVIHCAALVSWDERIDRSINANTLGTKRLLELAEGNPGLDRFQYVSSAFTHGRRCETPKCAENMFSPDVSIMAELHPERAPDFSVEAEIEAAQAYAREAEARGRDVSEFLGEAEKRALTGDGRKGAAEIAATLRQKEIDTGIADWGVKRAQSHGWFDNYTYSKALAEMLLVRHCPAHVRCSIVRPTGITACRAQPKVGWLDAYLLVEPLIHGVGTGKITAFPGDPAGVIDVIPADMVTSVMLAAAVVAGQEHGGTGVCGESGRGAPVAVYHCGSGCTNPVTLGAIETIWREYFHANPMYEDHAARRGPISVAPISFYATTEEFESDTRSKYLRPLEWALWGLERVPFWRSIPPLRAGWAKANKLAGLVHKTLRLAGLYCTYTLNEWIFDTAKTERLMGEGGLAEADRASFDFDVRAIDWAHFWTQVHIPFMRRYLLKEDGGPVPAAPAARL